MIWLPFQRTTTIILRSDSPEQWQSHGVRSHGTIIWKRDKGSNKLGTNRSGGKWLNSGGMKVVPIAQLV